MSARGPSVASVLLYFIWMNEHFAIPKVIECLIEFQWFQFEFLSLPNYQYSIIYVALIGKYDTVTYFISGFNFNTYRSNNDSSVARFSVGIYQYDRVLYYVIQCGLPCLLLTPKS